MVGRAVEPAHRRHQRQRARHAVVDHVPRRGPADEQVLGQVDAQVALPRLHVHGHEVGPGRQPDDVDHAADPPERAMGLVDDILSSGRIGDVAGDGHPLHAGRGDLLGHCACALRIEIGDRDARATLGQEQGARPADARAAPDHQGRSVAKSQCIVHGTTRRATIRRAVAPAGASARRGCRSPGARPSVRSTRGRPTAAPPVVRSAAPRRPAPTSGACGTRRSRRCGTPGSEGRARARRPR